MRTRIHGLYAITHEQLMPANQLMEKTQAALAGGCRWVQYRNKTATAKQRLVEARQLQQLCADYEAQLIINDDCELAAQVSAAGVHLGQNDKPVSQARERLGDTAIIGATCHSSLTLATTAAAQGASYVAFGRFFPSTTKPQAPAAAPELIAQATQQLALPTVAIGGINRHNVGPLIALGAHAVAVSYDLFASDNPADITARAKYYQSLFNRDSITL